MQSEKIYYRADIIREKSADTPTQLEYVEFQGVRTTKYDALVKEIAELFKSQTLKELVVNCDLAARHLEYVGLFQKVIPIIDIAEANPNSYTVEFKVKEPRQFRLGANVSVANDGEASASCTADKASLFGRGEGLASAYTHGVRGNHMFNIGLTKPFLGWQRYANVGAYVYRGFSSHPWSNFDATDTGVSAELNWRSFGKLQHMIKWNGAWRQLEPEKGAAFAIREHAGHTLKSSIENVVAYDTRNSPNLTTKGMLARLTQEYAGVFGDVGFIRHQLDVQAAAGLPLGLVLSSGLCVNFVKPLRGRTLHLLDRAYLGGPANLRGFGHNAIGPRADDSYMGGMASWAWGVHLYRPLIPAHMLFAHAFAVVGSVHGVKHDASFFDVLRRFGDLPRTSVGVGVAVKIGEVARLELNYAVPIRYSTTDRVVPGFQFGVGVSFL